MEGERLVGVFECNLSGFTLAGDARFDICGDPQLPRVDESNFFLARFLRRQRLSWSYTAAGRTQIKGFGRGCPCYRGEQEHPRAETVPDD